MLTQRLFPHVSELQYHEDGVSMKPRRRDAVDVVVSRRRRSRAGKRKLADDMRKKILQRAGKLPKAVGTVREGRGSLSVEGRRRAAAKFASSLKDDVARTSPPTITSVQFGPYPDAFAHAFGFWEPGHVKTANSPGG